MLKLEQIVRDPANLREYNQALSLQNSHLSKYIPEVGGYYDTIVKYPPSWKTPDVKATGLLMGFAGQNLTQWFNQHGKEPCVPHTALYITNFFGELSMLLLRNRNEWQFRDLHGDNIGMMTEVTEWHPGTSTCPMFLDIESFSAGAMRPKDVKKEIFLMWSSIEQGASNSSGDGWSEFVFLSSKKINKVIFQDVPGLEFRLSLVGC